MSKLISPLQLVTSNTIHYFIATLLYKIYDALLRPNQCLFPTGSRLLFVNPKQEVVVIVSFHFHSFLFLCFVSLLKEYYRSFSVPIVALLTKLEVNCWNNTRTYSKLFWCNSMIQRLLFTPLICNSAFYDIALLCGHCPGHFTASHFFECNRNTCSFKFSLYQESAFSLLVIANTTVILTLARLLEILLARKPVMPALLSSYGALEA